MGWSWGCASFRELGGQGTEPVPCPWLGLAGSGGDPAVGLAVPDRVRLAGGGEDDPFAVAFGAWLVAVQVEGIGGGDGLPPRIAGGDDGEVFPRQPDQRLGAERLSVQDSEPAEPVKVDAVTPGELAGQLDRWPQHGVRAGGHDTGSFIRAGSGGMIREGMMTSAVSGSWRTMSMVTRWDHFLLRMTRASRA